MYFDVALAVASALAAVGLAWMGIETSIRPPATKRRLIVVRSSFVLVAILAAVAPAWISYRASHQHDIDQGKIDSILHDINGRLDRLSTKGANVSVPSGQDEGSQAVELERRREFLIQLRSRWIGTHDSVSEKIVNGQQWPPEKWLNEQLGQYNQAWRVLISGSNFETYDLPAKRSVQSKNINQSPKNPNGFYQQGMTDPGEVTTPVIDNSKREVTFRAMFSDWSFDANKPFKFRALTLHIVHSDPPQKLETLGVESQIIENVTCEIVSDH